MLGSAFMVVYALAAPFAGFLVDRVVAPGPDRVGPGVLEPDLRGDGASLGRSASSSFFRAAEGLGESFYFPASMSILADYHGPQTRSRAMSIHQTSVYVGHGGGAWCWRASSASGYGWRSPFLVLGIDRDRPTPAVLAILIVEPVRGRVDDEAVARRRDEPPDEIATLRAGIGRTSLRDRDDARGGRCSWWSSSGRTSWRRRS